MKDYSLDLDDSKRFILSYKVENGKIITKLASGELLSFQYSKKKENRIITRMENQAKSARLEPMRMSEKILTIFHSMVLPIAIVNFASNAGWLNGLILFVVAENAIFHQIKAINHTIKKRELEKLNYFLEHKEEINQTIELSESKRPGVSKKAGKQVDLQKSENKQPLNINNIDNYSLRDLKMLREGIKRLSLHGFNEEVPQLENPTEESGQALKRIIDNRIR